jgi:hypothetical protein
VSGACAPGTPITCDDGDVCNGIETCIPETGSCAPGTPRCDDGDPCTDDVCSGGGTCSWIPADCDDGNPCTDDSCGENGCEHTFNTRSCDDGSLCTTGDTCSLGVCAGAPVLCSDQDACNGTETCDPATGTCIAGTPPTCDDGNPCTDDSCDTELGCLQIPNSDPCDDGSLCTTNDQCSGGQCTGESTCSDGDACNGEESCDEATGACGPSPGPLDCDDGNVCTTDACQPAVGCVYSNVTGVCDDGDPDTTGDQCVDGECVGIPPGGSGLCVPADCDDNVACTVDTCDPDVGCMHEATSTGVDGLLCMLQAIHSQLENPPALAFRSENVPRKLIKLISGAERKVQKVLVGTGRPRPLLARTRGTLSRFKNRIMHNQARLYIERNFGDELIRMSDGAKGIVTPLIKLVSKAQIAVTEAEITAASGANGPECTDD